VPLIFCDLQAVDKKKRDQLILQYAPLVKNIVGRMAVRFPLGLSDKEDLIGIGIVGLIAALDNFDPKRNVRFETYATWRIRGAILDDLRQRDLLSRQARARSAQLTETVKTLQNRLGRPPEGEEIAVFLGISLEDYHDFLDETKAVTVVNFEDLVEDAREAMDPLALMGDGRRDDPFEYLADRQTRKIIIETIENLPEKERLVLALYYQEELTMKEIGQVMDLTESRICQLHSQAVMRIRGALAGKV
jgi:RNA polymerase sigma factor for flagellar operon FliA